MIKGIYLLSVTDDETLTRFKVWALKGNINFDKTQVGVLKMRVHLTETNNPHQVIMSVEHLLPLKFCNVIRLYIKHRSAKNLKGKFDLTNINKYKLFELLEKNVTRKGF
jgi:hypothetical protein